MRTIRTITLLFAAAILSSLNSYAQYFDCAVRTLPKQMKIEQIDQYENRTVVCISYTCEEDVTWLNIDERTFARTADGKRYPLINSINLPISSEGESRRMLFDAPGQIHRFALEFARIPDGTPFDIIEDEKDSEELNFLGIEPDGQKCREKMDLQSFIADCPVKEMGRFVENDEYITYIKSEGLILTLSVQAAKQYGKYYIVHLELQNTTGRSILLDMNQIHAEGYKMKGDDISKVIPLEILNAQEYDKIVNSKQNWNNFLVAWEETSAALDAGEVHVSTSYSNSSSKSKRTSQYDDVFGYANAYGSTYTTSYGEANFRLYNGAAAYAAQQQANANYNAYASEQARIREELNAGYIRSNTIKDGVEYSGFFNIRYKKADRLRIDIRINGEDFTFNF